MELFQVFSESVEAKEWRTQDLKWRQEERRYRQREVVWREQDLEWRQNEKMVIALDQKERVVDLKCRAMKSIANLSALVAGFTIVMFVELTVDPSIPHWLVAIYALCSATEVALMAAVMVQATLMLTAVTLMTVKKNRKAEFVRVWNEKFKDKWSVTFRLFSWAAPIFFLTIGLSAWVKFYNVPAAGIAVTIVCSLSILMWFGDYRYYGRTVKGGLEFFALDVDKMVEEANLGSGPAIGVRNPLLHPQDTPGVGDENV